MGTPVSIHFNPSNSAYIVTHSTKISLHHSNNDKMQRSYSRFTEDAFCGKFRRDGKLIVAGDRSGYVKVFDVKTKSALREIHGHSSSVRGTCWSSDGLSIVSCSDDKKVKRWDLGTGQVTWQSSKAHHHQHKDYVRTVDVSPINSTIFASGSYDHSVCIWDCRQEEAVCRMDHGQPIDYCLISPSGSLLMSAGSNEIKLWDMLSGGRLLHTFSNHQKNVTGLCMNGSGSKLLSCGLDGFVKIYSMESLQVIHGIKYSGPCMSLALASNDSKLLVGLVDGTLVVRNRVSDDVNADDDADAKVEDHVVKRQRQFYKSAGAAIADPNEGIIAIERSVKLKPYENHLKKFNYQQALDAALSTRNPVVVVTVMEELCRRNGLTIALSGRDETSLEPLLSFAAKYVSHPRYSKLVSQVTQVILDIYAPIIGQSDAIDELFVKLHQQVKLEVTFQRQANKVMNALDGVINMSSSNSLKSLRVAQASQQQQAEDS
jgi:U3 small nucleolar RNA-associated protein 15